MPPEVGKAGSATGPVVVHGSGEVEQPKTPDLKSKPAEQRQDAPKSKPVPYRATTKEASNRKAELAASTASQQTSIWKNFNNITSAASAAVGELTTKAAKSVQQQDMLKLSQREYRQDMLPGQHFEVEKITPGATNKTQSKERVEDLSRGDVSMRRYHQEQHRESTKSGVEDRLRELNGGKELTQFEKKLVEEWNPNKKDGVASLSPIMALDRTGTNGPPGVQGYRVERGESDSKYRQVTYYDRDGNALVKEPTIQEQKINRLSKTEHPQDMVPGEYFQAERIHPGNTNQTKTTQKFEMVKAKIHSEQERHATESGLEDRLKELNQGKELTPFEKKLVGDWDPNKKGHDAIETLSPILKLDSTGTQGSTEVEGYKVERGGTGNRQTTYYDRDGNELRSKRTGGEAIATDGPVDYISMARVAGKVAVNTGKKIGKEVLEKETRTAAKAEANTLAKSEADDVAKAEASAATKAETNTAAKLETKAGAKVKNAPTQEGLTAKMSENQAIRRQQEKVVDDAIGSLDDSELIAIRDKLQKEGVLNPGNKINPNQVGPILRDGQGMRIPGDRQGILRETREALEKTRDPELIELLENRRIRLGQRETTIPDELRRLREARLQEHVENPGARVPQEQGYPKK